jgi:hypothetical protein
LRKGVDTQPLSCYNKDTKKEREEKTMTKFDKAKKKEVSRKDKWYIVTWREFCCPFWLCPLIPVAIVIDKLEKWNYNRKKWSEKRATRMLHRILPHYLEWVEEENAYYFDMDCYYRYMYTKARFFDKAWGRKFEYELYAFIRDGYENDRYIKSEERYEGRLYIKFTEK